MRICVWGGCFFEIESYSKKIDAIRHNGQIRFWEEFPAADPFQFGLYRIDMDCNDNIVYEKFFYERKTGIMEKFCQVVKPYSEEEFLSTLEKYGMKGDIFHCYKELGDLREGLYLCVAKKIKDL